MVDLDFSQKYPFSKDAKEALESSKVIINERIIERALERLRASIKGESKLSSAIHPIEKVESIAGFAASRMILSYMRNKYLQNRFAVAEAKRAYSYLNNESESNVEKMLDEFNFNYKRKGGKIYVHFSTYLAHTPGSLDYRLINRNLEGGFVLVNNHELLRLVQEAIKEKISKIPILKEPSEHVIAAAKKITNELPKITPAKISFKKGANPPCVENLLVSVKKHFNLNHHARWFLAVYLLNKKMDVEKIVELYSDLPDFSEKITRYQIEHAKNQNYMVPSCSTVKGYGICVANCPIKNPIAWKKDLAGRVKIFKKEDENES